MEKETKEIIAVITGFVILVLILWTVTSYQEAKRFNALTGKNVTTWDAMWIEFRIQEGIK